MDPVTGHAQEILRHAGRVEAPNISPCGGWILVNSEGRLWRVDLDNPRLCEISTGVALACNNDHGFTAEGDILFGSHFEGQGAQIYQIPAVGVARDARPEKISSHAPSWWHGLSPDGSVMTYAAVRNSARIVDIYTRSLKGGDERRLTFALGHNDGPDFSADGKSIYWNSDRSGHAQIWVMAADGENPRQLFHDSRVNWFPHPSPCGRWLIWISYPPGTKGHPYDLPVRLMISDAKGEDRRILAEFTGGQGSLNVPSWAPDGGRFAFVHYSS